MRIEFPKHGVELWFWLDPKGLQKLWENGEIKEGDSEEDSMAKIPIAFITITKLDLDNEDQEVVWPLDKLDWSMEKCAKHFYPSEQ